MFTHSNEFFACKCTPCRHSERMAMIYGKAYNYRSYFCVSLKFGTQVQLNVFVIGVSCPDNVHVYVRIIAVQRECQLACLPILGEDSLQFQVPVLIIPALHFL